MKEACIRWECYVDTEQEQIAKVRMCIILNFVCSKGGERDRGLRVYRICVMTKGNKYNLALQ